jgi:hypothetical protein
MKCISEQREKEDSMPTDSRKVVDSYIGMDDFLKVYTLVHDGLVKLGFTEDKANRYAWFCQAIYKELKDQHDAIDGLQKTADANKLLPEAVAMNLVKSTGALKDFRFSAGVSVVAPFVDRLATIAKLNGIELNDCSLSVTKLALDIAGAGTGAVTSVGLIGIPLLFLSVAATFNDSLSLAKACSQ